MTAEARSGAVKSTSLERSAPSVFRVLQKCCGVELCGFKRKVGSGRKEEKGKRMKEAEATEMMRSSLPKRPRERYQEVTEPQPEE